MPPCLLSVAKLQFPWLADIQNLCCELNWTLETWAALCGSDSFLGSIDSGFFSEQCETVTDWKAEWNIWFFLCSVACVVFYGSLSRFVRSSVPSLPIA